MDPARLRKLAPKVAVAAVVIVGVALAAFYLHKRTTAPRGPKLTLYGNVEATEVHLAFELSGRVETFAVKEGDAVAANQGVAQLEDADLMAREAEAKAAVEVAKAAVLQAEAALSFSRQNSEAQVGQARAALAAARARLLELERGARPQEVDRAEADVQLAKAELDRADSEWARIQKLFSQHSVTES